MGSFVEINDTLQLTKEQGFPQELDLEKHLKNPYAAKDFENKVFEFPISSGLYNWTPTGEFWVWIKLRYTLMTGGNKALHTYYYLPNVPFTMYFENDNVSRTKGYGIHGAYWHNDFGRPKSHGCVNLRPEDAEKLYYWTEPNLNGKNSIRTTEDNPGTRIIIYGQYQG